MKWEFCKYCRINGKCENQDRGHKCETGYKILFEENEKLKELLEIAVNTLKRIKTQSEFYFYFEEESSTNCDSYAAERSIYDLSLKTLKQIKELEK